MKKVLVAVASLSAVLPLSGCHILLGKVISKSQYKDTLRSAPAIPNPAKTGAPTDTPVHGNDGVAYKMSAFSPSEMCFDATVPQPPENVQRMTYEVQALKGPDDDRDEAPKLRSASTRILDSTSEVRPVTRRERVDVKDSSGRVISYIEQDVQRLETFYKTEARICFANPTIVTADTRFLVMVPLELQATEWLSGHSFFAVWRLE